MSQLRSAIAQTYLLAVLIAFVIFRLLSSNTFRNLLVR